MHEPAESPNLARCPNSSSELTGEYCSVCGQQRIDPGDLSARRFLHDLVDEVGTLKKRFKALRTLGASKATRHPRLRSDATRRPSAINVAPRTASSVRRIEERSRNRRAFPTAIA